MCCCCLLILLLSGLLLSNAVAIRPNILTIIADDMGWNDVGFHGGTQIPTPNIDALAYMGVTFSRHYTLPICSPSRAAFLTGYHALRTGLQGYPIKAGERTALPLNFQILPEYLKELGYQTHLVGKWHQGYYQTRYMPTQRGFDHHLGYLNGWIDYFSHHTEERNVTGLDFRNNLEVANGYTDLYATQIFTNETIKIINEYNSSEPFYIHLAHLAPHSPLQVVSKEENDKMFGNIKDHLRRRYAGMVTELDNSVGHVIDALRKNGLLENTIILFFSDNGGNPESPGSPNRASNWPLRGQKFTLFEGGIRGNAALWSAGLKNPGRIYDSLFHISDWLPTLFTAAGGDPKYLGALDGINQWEYIRDDKPGPRNETVLNVDQQSNTSGYLKNGWKLMVGNYGQDFDGYFGPIGREETLNSSSIISSLVAQAFVSIGAKPLSEEEVSKMAARLNITCTQTLPDKNSTLFLFNIFEDPCETNNLATENPSKLNELLKDLSYWESLAVPYQSKDVDPLSNPKFFDGVWSPWLGY